MRGPGIGACERLEETETQTHKVRSTASGPESTHLLGLLVVWEPGIKHQTAPLHRSPTPTPTPTLCPLRVILCVKVDETQCWRPRSPHGLFHRS